MSKIDRLSGPTAEELEELEPEVPEPATDRELRAMGLTQGSLEKTLQPVFAKLAKERF